MPTYSPNGYVAAISIRTNRTLLVEGPTDKSVIARLMIELRYRQLLNADNVVVDTAADIQNVPGSRLGNREKVEYLHSLIGGNLHFAALVDREFRDFALAPPADQAPYHSVIGSNLFWTRGHSIENYFSTLGLVIAALEEHQPEYLPANYANLLASAFPEIVRACATMSLAALGIHKLDRIRTINRLDFWVVDSAGNLSVDLTELRILLADRGLDPTELANFVSYWHYYTPLLAAADLALSQWICHGHLADSHLWCAVAALLRHFGMPNSIACRLAWGLKEAQFRTVTERWCQACAGGAGEHPRELLEWLRG